MEGEQKMRHSEHQNDPGTDGDQNRGKCDQLKDSFSQIESF
jgi:hypothetical protein